MATAEADARRGAEQTAYFELELWQRFDQTHECRVLLCPETTGGFSAHALRLPGVVSQGETVDSALENIADAFRGAIAVYREMNEDIPWAPVEIERPLDAMERWILVDV